MYIVGSWLGGFCCLVKGWDGGGKVGALFVRGLRGLRRYEAGNTNLLLGAVIRNYAAVALVRRAKASL